ncbi:MULTISPECIES: mechanosensitive ion channel family protein [unclassified Saccharopolyspora]|uniref:mechanosensitive ion channel family protein n=1 Tax=unclassified Saccharopolyspora TaxID=2646250 RepID=UPI001CD2FFED|nr:MULTISPECIES: mechanosensitive ion channel family protein [unclassified Saccharopolyspora]MCA1186965.1 mechanosensitive ion channel family protein [Saccharopolyspora sp. 6T]MCA1192656.1 mechanosensitive ion channel family protein [Saccharopolyspora sp. 6V]MCA1227756.1 mechanosensitive ion channel family protein [Saccharopolyspora sp. 6M]MCA1281808.1 mechanosensitive ion channel family protein [Saccharopolyspora sp. 7B]
MTPPLLTQPLLTQPNCVEDDGSWCQTVFSWTGNEWLAMYSELLIAKPLNIVMIVIIALLVRYFVHRTISRLTRGNGGKTPKLLVPLKERRPESSAMALLSERRMQRARTIGSVLKSLSSFVIFGLALMYALKSLGIELAPILASAGVLGVAVAFGAQNLVRDFLSGMFMMVEDQYGVGDIVDLGEASGTVEAVGLRVTTLRDLNGTVWYVRNGEILRVGNSSQGFAVAVVDFPISHTSSVEKAMEVALRVATEAAAREPLSKDVLNPPDMLGVDKITSDTITLRLTVKVRPSTQWAVQRRLRVAIKRAYDEENIEPPYPHGRPQLDSAQV